nr:hypothetical protein [Tanacetum cinerariifolium]
MTRRGNSRILTPYADPEKQFRFRKDITPMSFEIIKGSESRDPRLGEMYFEIKGQFLKELKDNTFSRNKDDDAYGNVEKVWERYNDILYKCPTHNLNNYQKVSIFYKGLEIPTRRMLDFCRPTPGMTATEALVAIQEMIDHSHKWHDRGIIRGLRGSSSNGISVITNKLVLQNELPPKEKDPGSFILPCKIGLGNQKPIRMLIEMADKSMQSPKGIIENIMVKIDKNIFLVDFIILDIVEDDKVPIILGRPMLATAHAKFDVFVPNGFGVQENLEEFLMNDDINADLGDFLELNDLLSEYDGDPFGVLSDSKSEIGIGLDDFSGNLEDILIKQAL